MVVLLLLEMLILLKQNLESATATSEMRKIMKRMLRYFVQADKIDTSNVTATKYEDPENQLSNDDLEVGETT